MAIRGILMNFASFFFEPIGKVPSIQVEFRHYF